MRARHESHRHPTHGSTDRRGCSRLSWGAISAGFVGAAVIQIVLSVLGLAISLSAFDPGRNSFGGYGVGVTIWFMGAAEERAFLPLALVCRVAARSTMVAGNLQLGLPTLRFGRCSAITPQVEAGPGVRVPWQPKGQP